jgi:hypothetical protein
MFWPNISGSFDAKSKPGGDNTSSNRQPLGSVSRPKEVAALIEEAASQPRHGPLITNAAFWFAMLSPLIGLICNAPWDKKRERLLFTRYDSNQPIWQSVGWIAVTTFRALIRNPSSPRNATSHERAHNRPR